MKTSLRLIMLPLISGIILLGCEKDTNDGPIDISGGYIASYQVASEMALRSIPGTYIDAARNNLHIAYQHTSHGTHVSRGLFGLPDFQDGDDALFGITNNDPTPDKLDFRDYALESYAPEGINASDLSQDQTAFIQTTRNYLDDPDNHEINVVMWSWCSISGKHVTEHYLPGMQTLIDEYGPGGSKIGNEEGKREVPVTFIFMTGHAESNSNVGDGRPKNQADTIIGYCQAKGYYCLDYYGIDTHDMNGNYWEDTGDDGDSDDYGGNFYIDWQRSHKLGEHYYENRNRPGGSVVYGEHNSQHITANRKAFAMWYILAQVAGWDGK